MPYLAAPRAAAIPRRLVFRAPRGRVALLAAALLLAACGSGEDADARLAARRAALGLGGGPIPFAEAMARMQVKGYEGLLARVGSRGLAPGEALDAALEIEDLLARADPTTASARPPDPPVFDMRMRDARERARALSRALAGGGTGKDEAGELVGSCVACHVTFRAPR